MAEISVASGVTETGIKENFVSMFKSDPRTGDPDTSLIEIAALQAVSKAMDQLEAIPDMPHKVAMDLIAKGRIRFTAELVVDTEHVE